MANLYAPNMGRLLNAEPKSAYTPAIGDLVVWDLTAAWQVDKAADNEVPIGILKDVNRAGTVVEIELFSSGSLHYLTYTGTMTLGYNVRSHGDNTVEEVASGGVGTIVAKDAPSGKVAVHF